MQRHCIALNVPCPIFTRNGTERQPARRTGKASGTQFHRTWPLPPCRELTAAADWYNECRPHTWPGGRTPNERYTGRFPANRWPRFEPRPLAARLAVCEAMGPGARQSRREIDIGSHLSCRTEAPADRQAEARRLSCAIAVHRGRRATRTAGRTSLPRFSPSCQRTARWCHDNATPRP